MLETNKTKYVSIPQLMWDLYTHRVASQRIPSDGGDWFKHVLFEKKSDCQQAKRSRVVGFLSTIDQAI
jgi:hypothetical protein